MIRVGMIKGTRKHHQSRPTLPNIRYLVSRFNAFFRQQRKKQADMPSLRALVPQYFFLVLNLDCFYTNNFNTFLLFSKQIKADIKKVYYSLIFFQHINVSDGHFIHEIFRQLLHCKVVSQNVLHHHLNFICLNSPEIENRFC